MDNSNRVDFEPTEIENPTEERERLIIQYADYNTFREYVIQKYERCNRLSHYEKKNMNYYSIKRIKFINREVPILLQNKNGPCPLLCISNILLLRNQMTIEKGCTNISQKNIEQKIMEVILRTNKYNATSQTSFCNYRQNILECVEILPQLKYGLDLNCKFTDIQAFEYTKGLCIFDMLNIPLYHGWVISSNDSVFYPYLKNYSYNVVINKIIRYNEYYDHERKVKERTKLNESNDLLKKRTDEFLSEINQGDQVNKKCSDIPVFPDDLEDNTEEPKTMSGDSKKEKTNHVNLKVKKSKTQDSEFKFSNYLSKPLRELKKKSWDVRQKWEDLEVLNNIRTCKSLNPIDKDYSDFFTEVANHTKTKIPAFPEETDSNREEQPLMDTLKAKKKNPFNFIKSMSSGVKKNFKEPTQIPFDENSPDNLKSSCPIKYEETHTVQNKYSDYMFNEIKQEDVKQGEYNKMNHSPSKKNSIVPLSSFEIHEAIIMSEFLESYKTQLTQEGLKMLQAKINQNELAGFFRNNHFSTIFKYKGKLFLLATDSSFLHLNCSWELFDNVNNDTSYFDDQFISITKQKRDQRNAKGLFQCQEDYYNQKSGKYKFGNTKYDTSGNNVHAESDNRKKMKKKKKQKKRCNII